MQQQEISANRKRLRVLNATIYEKHVLPVRSFPDLVEDSNEEKLRAQIALLVKDIHPDFLFPKEYGDTLKERDVGHLEYSDSPLARAIKYNDAETAALIINKEGIKPKHFVINGKVPSIEQAMASANEEIANLIVQRLPKEMKIKYKSDLIETFGESKVTDAIQSKSPITIDNNIQRG